MAIGVISRPVASDSNLHNVRKLRGPATGHRAASWWCSAAPPSPADWTREEAPRSNHVRVPSKDPVEISERHSIEFDGGGFGPVLHTNHRGSTPLPTVTMEHVPRPDGSHLRQLYYLLASVYNTAIPNPFAEVSPQGDTATVQLCKDGRGDPQTPSRNTQIAQESFLKTHPCPPGVASLPILRKGGKRDHNPSNIPLLILQWGPMGDELLQTSSDHAAPLDREADFRTDRLAQFQKRLHFGFEILDGRIRGRRVSP